MLQNQGIDITNRKSCADCGGGCDHTCRAETPAAKKSDKRRKRSHSEGKAEEKAAPGGNDPGKKKGLFSGNKEGVNYAEDLCMWCAGHSASVLCSQYDTVCVGMLKCEVTIPHAYIIHKEVPRA